MALLMSAGCSAVESSSAIGPDAVALTPSSLSRAGGVQRRPRRARAERKDPFLIALGERVRALRARRGMTRKALAQATDVSERHLANLEYGVGNASILVLLQVTRGAAMLASPSSSATSRRIRPNGCSCGNCWRTATRRRCAACAVAVGELLGTRRRRSAPAALVAHRADRPARRGQVDARPHAGRRPRFSVHRAHPRDREDGRLQHRRDPRPLRPERLPPLRAPRARGGDPDPTPRRSSPPPAASCPISSSFNLLLATARRSGCRRTRRTTWRGSRPRRHAADGREPRGDGGPQGHPRRPDGVLFKGGLRVDTSAQPLLGDLRDPARRGARRRSACRHDGHELTLRLATRGRHRTRCSACMTAACSGDHDEPPGSASTTRPRPRSTGTGS